MDANSESQFESWYERSYSRIAGAVAMMFGSPDLGEEAASEAFARAYSRWGQVRHMGSPEAWTHRVAVNVAKRRLRRASLERRLLQKNRPVDDTMPPPHPPSEVWEAVDGLPDRMRQAIVLRYVGDLSQADIAAVMGVAPGTVAAHLHAGRERLGAMLGVPLGSREEQSRG
ncbi:MAG: sigma-70 family RNA polymerase sigma factor [Nitriliruptorales bacterium]|nr:sigma-70 family RNA polymerase sigma factor [Nitriliruptorales bacterium]